MAKLKPYENIDLIVSPHVYTDEDHAAIREALAQRRKAPGHTRAIAALTRMAKRLKPAQATVKARAARK